MKMHANLFPGTMGSFNSFNREKKGHENSLKIVQFCIPAVVLAHY